MIFFKSLIKINDKAFLVFRNNIDKFRRQLKYYFFILFSLFFVKTSVSQKLNKDQLFRIKTLIDLPITNFSDTKDGYVTYNGVRIWYEKINSTKPNNKGTVLIINGASSDSYYTPYLLIKQLLDSAYHVVRFDNRGVGASDWVKNKKTNSYNLRDMGADAIHVLDALSIEKVHIIGTSMGAMITQEIAIAYPKRVLSATLFMTSGNIKDKTLPHTSLKTKRKLIMSKLKYGKCKTIEQSAQYQLCLKSILLNTTSDSINIEDIVTGSKKNITAKKGYNTYAFMHHYKAEKLNGARYEALKEITSPTLIIHGLKDPLLSYKHSEKCASYISHSKLILVPNMGHTLTDKTILELMPTIFENIKVNVQ